MSSTEIESFWRFIRSSVDRILSSGLEGLNEDDRNCRPLDNANSLYVLDSHTMANLEENMLVVLRGQKAFRDRVYYGILRDEWKGLQSAQRSQ